MYRYMWFLIFLLVVVLSSFSATSNNWLFKGKIQALDSLSGKSSIFNAHSDSEESLNIMVAHRSRRTRYVNASSVYVYKPSP